MTDVYRKLNIYYDLMKVFLKTGTTFAEMRQPKKFSAPWILLHCRRSRTHRLPLLLHVVDNIIFLEKVATVNS